MSKARARRGAALAGLMAVVLTVTACAGGAGGAQSDRVFVKAIGGDPMSVGLNAQFVGGTLPPLFSSQILEPLIFLSGDNRLTPGLAESWELGEAGVDLTLHLRQGVMWHDGTPFTAEDVKFNFEEIVPLQTYGVELAERIEAVEITDASTVVLHLTEPYGPLLENVASQFMLPRHIYAGTDYVTNPANKRPIGTGPMVFDSYESGEQVVLAKNPDYWGGEPQVDRAVFAVMGDANSRAEALFAGELDQARLDPSQQDRVSQDPNTKLLDVGSFPQVETLTFNTTSEYFQDPTVRRAVFAALDREAMVEKALSGVGTVATGFFPPSLEWAVNPEVNFDEDFPRDLDAINAALDAAGFERGPDGTRFTITILYILTLQDVAGIVEMARSMLGEIGINTEVVQVGGAEYVQKYYKELAYDLSFVRINIGPEPSLGIAPRYACNEERLAGHNGSGLCDQQIDEAATVALGTADQATRAEAFKTLQARASELMFYAPIAWYQGAFPTVNTSRWEGQDSPRLSPRRIPWMKMSRTDPA